MLIHGLPALTGRREPSVFLDKVCINQSHVGLKALGINGLETFLKYSRRMVLLYDVTTCAAPPHCPLLSVTVRYCPLLSAPHVVLLYAPSPTPPCLPLS